MKYNNINNENFFNHCKEEYPKAVKYFCDWIDNLKFSLNYNDLFNEGATSTKMLGSTLTSCYTTKAPKFHELPFELQEGIIMKFLYENGFSMLILEATNHKQKLADYLLIFFKTYELLPC